MTGDFLFSTFGGGSKVIQVQGFTPRPLAQNDAYRTTKYASLQVIPAGVLANDSDPDGNLLTEINVTHPIWSVIPSGRRSTTGFRFRADRLVGCRLEDPTSSGFYST